MKHSIKDCAFFAALVLLVFSSCKKDKKEEPGTDPIVESNTKQIPTNDRRELTNDSLFLYAKQIYYWNTSLPAYDTYEPRKYTGSGTDLINYENNLLNIGKASGSADYLSGESQLKYSYIEDITTRNPEAISVLKNTKASVDLEGNGNDIGIRPIIYTTSATTKEYLLFVTAVYPGSDADKQGVKRGWHIKKINGQDIGTDYDREGALLNTLFEDNVTIEGDKYSAQQVTGTFDVTLHKTNYKSSPVYLSKVFTAGTKKIGYLNYARFSNEDNSVPVLDKVFSDFVSAGVTDLIVDLRYNGGGYVNTAEHLINLIAPSSATGVMYKEYFNTTMQTGKATIMKNQPILGDNDEVRYYTDPGTKETRIVNYFDDADYSVQANTYPFEKAGGLGNVTNVVFIVSGSTASASELVMNSLKPKMNVRLVGDRTYGKPVGFFPVRLENKYDVLFAMFETKNSADQGGYFSGMIPDYAENAADEHFFDDPRYDFGDKSEPYTAKAISLLNPSSAAVSARSGGSMMSIRGKEVSFNNGSVLRPVKEGADFSGMIETRTRLRKR